eukprot:6063118-Pyramimonas_sp.AAC.2
MDFSQYSSKLEKEQKTRGEKVRRDKERLAREKARADQKRAELEEARRVERLRKEAEEEQLQLLIEAAREANGGLYLNVRLQPVPFDPSEKGIVRGKDKISLPPSVRESLREQGAERQYSAPMFFELALSDTYMYGSAAAPSDGDASKSPFEDSATNPSSDGREETKVLRTHGAVLEFSASEGTIGLPPLIAERLGGDTLSQQKVYVKYTKLPKCTWGRLQPIGHEFQTEIENVREVRPNKGLSMCVFKPHRAIADELLTGFQPFNSISKP